MNRSSKQDLQSKMIRLVYFVWASVILLSFFFQVYQENRQTRNLAIEQAKAMFLKEKTFRLWTTSSGDTFFPLTETTPSSPHLVDLQERDLSILSDSASLHPSETVRRILKQFETEYGVKAHIASSNYQREETAPDEWEKNALSRLRNGEEIVIAFGPVQGEPSVRMMGPLFTGKSCLKCHASQGYKEGDFRGGVSLTMPLTRFIEERNRSILVQFLAHSLFAGSGFLVLFLYVKKMKRVQSNEDRFMQVLEHWGNIFEHARWGIVIVDSRNDSIQLANPGFYNMHGYLPGTTQGVSIYRFFPDREHNKIKKHLNEIELVGSEQIETEQQRKDKTTFPSLVDIGIVKSPGDPFRVLNIRNISVQKSQEYQLEESRNFLRNILDAQRNIVVVNEDGLLVEANAAFFEFFPEYLDLDDFRDKHKCICELFKKTDKEGYIFKNREGKPWLEILETFGPSFPRVMIERPGGTHHFTISYKKVAGTGPARYILVLTDITELMVYRENLEERVTQESEKRRQHEEKFLEQFRLAQLGSLLENIAHHWRQPLNNIGLIIQNLEMESQEKGTLSVTGFRKRSSIILEIIQDLSGKIEQFQDLEIRPASDAHFPVRATIQRTIELYDPSLKSAGIQVKWGSAEEAEIPGDSRFLTETILILFSNTIDAIRERNIELSEIRFEIERRSTLVFVSIADQGGGISETVLHRIFEPFFTTKGKINRTGLGLYFARKYIERDLSGQIYIENAGKGTEVGIQLPVFPSDS